MIRKDLEIIQNKNNNNNNINSRIFVDSYVVAIKLLKDIYFYD